MIVGLGHVARSGKDTAAAALAYWPTVRPEHRFRRIAFADALKRLALEADPIIVGRTPGFPAVHLSAMVSNLGWEEAKIYSEVRRFLQALGVAVRNGLGADIWVRAVFDQIGLGENVAIPDVRFLNEAEAIQAAGGKVVRIDRPGYVAAGHISETQLATWDGWDAVITNDGTEMELRNAIRALVLAWRSEIVETPEPEPDVHDLALIQFQQSAARRVS